MVSTLFVFSVKSYKEKEMKRQQRLGKLERLRIRNKMTEHFKKSKKFSVSKYKGPSNWYSNNISLHELVLTVFVSVMVA